MKLNRWTATLAAAGLVTIPSLLQAQTNTVLTSLSSTTLSGYVDTSAQWNLGTGNQNMPPYGFGGTGKADGFNLNVVDIALDKPQDESPWATGYHVELWFGPDANALATSSSGTATSDFAIRQAYVALRTPIGNGINWKIGVWDTIIGYEGLSSPNNPNYTHSYGFTVEPTTHTGLLGTYQVNDEVSVSAGVANTFGATINGRAKSPYGAYVPNESFKTYLASVSFTAPTNWGWLSGSTISGGVINGFNQAAAEGSGDRQTSLYAGATLSTPLTALKLGASLDYVDMHDYAAVNGEGQDGSIWAAAIYASYQATEKLALNVRGEFVDDSADALGDSSELGLNRAKIYALTGTVQYDLWKNVLSRVEIRWDHADNGRFFGASDANGAPTRKNAVLIAANVIYKF
jgi:hypothetical protein